jgi:O-antigen ligase
MPTFQISTMPAILVALLFGTGLLFALIVNLRAAFAVIGVMFFLAGISVIVDYDKNVYRTFLLPLQAYRTELFGIFGAVLTVGLMPHLSKLSVRWITGHAWVLIAIGLYGALLRFYFTTPVDGLASIGYVLFAIFTLSLVIPALIREEADILRLVRVIVWVMAVWGLLAAAQFAISPKLVLLGPGNRFTGLIANCNQAATLLSVVAVCSLWLAVNLPRAARLPYVLLTCLFVVLLVWTGSRGGMGMFTLGMAAVLFSRVGRAILLLPVFILVAFLLLQLAAAANVELQAERLLTTQDTRSAGWASLIRDGLESPLIGVGPAEVQASENSYLLAFASFGIGMLFLCLLFAAVGAWHCLKLLRLRLGADRQTITFIDLCLGQQVMFFAGTVFEGYMHARVGSNIVVLLIFTAVGCYLIRRQAELTGDSFLSTPDDWEEEYLEEHSEDDSGTALEPHTA